MSSWFMIFQTTIIIHSFTFSLFAQFSKAMSKMDCADTQTCAAQHAPNFDDTCSTQENTVDSTEQQGKRDTSQIKSLFCSKVSFEWKYLQNCASVCPHIVDICMRTSEVPEFESTIEIGPDSTDDLSRRFQVSPEHSPGMEAAAMTRLMVNNTF